MYEPAFHPGVEEDLKGLDRPTRRCIFAKIGWLLEHADVVRHEPFTAQWAGLYKLRVGDYRVVYEVDHEGRKIIIHAVGHGGKSISCVNTVSSDVEVASPRASKSSGRFCLRWPSGDQAGF